MPPRLTDLAHRFAGAALTPGCRALDATAGTGADTVFLAAGVGPGGRVHAFDIQAPALRRARQRAEEAGLAERIHWHHASHAELGAIVGDERFMAVMFNLGWLPGGDRHVVTRPATTLAALDAGAARLAPGGHLTILAYRGHAGGRAEHAAVEEWVDSGAHGLECQQRLAADGGQRPGPVLYGLLCSARGGAGAEGAGRRAPPP